MFYRFLNKPRGQTVALLNWLTAGALALDATNLSPPAGLSPLFPTYPVQICLSDLFNLNLKPKVCVYKK